MSAPNKNYNPVAVTALSAAAVNDAIAAALDAIAAATTLAELKELGRAHRATGPRSGRPTARSARSRRRRRPTRGAGVASPRPRGHARDRGPPGPLEPDRDARMLVDERVDVTLPWGPPVRPARATR